jgi:hypothetical protein
VQKAIQDTLRADRGPARPGPPTPLCAPLKCLVAHPTYCLSLAGQNDAGMRLECGAIAPQPSSAEPRCNSDSIPQRRNCIWSRFFRVFLLTRKQVKPYIPPSRRAARLPGAWACRRSISLRIVKAASEVDRKPSASTALEEDFPVHREVETARFPGCLKIESEERETWTAESLRAAFMIEACFDQKERSRKRIRRFTFKVHR